MSKYDKLINLFKDVFITESFFSRGEAKDFKCPHIKDCDVKKIKTPILSPALGDENTNIMIVAEAPSRRKKK